MSWLLDGRPVTSVLVTRLRYLGDVAMTTVALEVLKAGAPGLRVGYLCEAAHGAILAGHPDIDRLHLLGARRRGADARARAGQGGGEDPVVPRGTLGMVAELRRARYDLAVDLFFNPRSAWLLRLAGIPRRIGGTRGGRRRLYTHIVRRAELPAEPLDRIAPGGLGEHLCRLAPLVHAETGRNLLDWASDRFPAGTLRPRVAGRRDGDAAPDGPVLAAPAATWPSKEWPRDHWRRFLTGWAEGPGPRLEVLVPPGREQDWGDIADGLPPERVSALPPGGLDGVKAKLATAAGLVTADGGVMHLGVALGVPTLAIFGPTAPETWFPYEGLGPFRVLATRPACHPCDLHACDAFVCLPDLAPGTVLAEARDLFGGIGGGT